MKIQLMAHNDDSFSLEVEITHDSPTAAEADFLSQLLQTAFPEPLPQVQMQRSVDDVRDVEERLRALGFRYTADKGTSEPEHAWWGPEAMNGPGDEGVVPVGKDKCKLWAERVVDAIEAAHPLSRDDAIRALAEELNNRGVTLSSGEMKIKGGAWRSKIVHECDTVHPPGECPHDSEDAAQVQGGEDVVVTGWDPEDGSEVSRPAMYVAEEDQTLAGERTAPRPSPADMPGRPPRRSRP